MLDFVRVLPISHQMQDQLKCSQLGWMQKGPQSPCEAEKMMQDRADGSRDFWGESGSRELMALVHVRGFQKAWALWVMCGWFCAYCTALWDIDSP